MDESSWVVLGALLVSLGHIIVVLLAGQFIECPSMNRLCAIPEALRRLAVVQLLYVIPMFWWARQSGRREMAKGVLIMAALTVLLSGMCWLF
jgi:hypothetical protein